MQRQFLILSSADQAALDTLVMQSQRATGIDQVAAGQGFALLCVSYPTADCVIKANAEELLS